MFFRLSQGKKHYIQCKSQESHSQKFCSSPEVVLFFQHFIIFNYINTSYYHPHYSRKLSFFFFFFFFFFFVDKQQLFPTSHRLWRQYCSIKVSHKSKLLHIFWLLYCSGKCLYPYGYLSIYFIHISGAL